MNEPVGVREMEVPNQFGNLDHEISSLEKLISDLSKRLDIVTSQSPEPCKPEVPVPEKTLCSMASSIRQFSNRIRASNRNLETQLSKLEI